MRRYIYHRPQAKEVIPNIEGVNLLERSKVLLQLLANRDAVRIVCAPSLYGKSVAAYQYGEIAFPMGNVTWVDASDPRFLCSLDDGRVIEHLESAGRGGLVVLDNVGDLDALRMRGFVSVLDAVLSSHAEVLITTRSCKLQAEVPFPTVVVDACDLQIEGTEASSQFANHLYSPKELRGRGVPPVLLDAQYGVDRFLASLCDHQLSTSDEALSMLAMIVARGKVSDLLGITEGSDTCSLSLLERNHPHAGVTSRSSMFAAIDLLMDQRKDLLLVHMDSLVQHSAVESPHDLVLNLTKILLANGDEAFARKISENYLDESELAFLFRTKPLISVDNSNAQTASHLGDVHDVEAPIEGSACPLDESLTDSDIVNIRMFGSFDISRDGIHLPEKGELRQKAKVLLALLMVNHDKEVPLFWVQRVLWPDADTNNTRTNFYNLWSYLRSVLKSKERDVPELKRSRDTVSLRGLNMESDLIQLEDAIDVVKNCSDPRECERVLSRIIQIYRGPLMPGVQNEQLDAYRSMYENKVLDAMVDGATFLSSKGEAKLAQRFAAFAFETDPSREDVCYLFMSMQKRLGQFAGAISTFMMCRRVLVDRFGIDGSRRLDALYEEILNEVS